MKYWSSELIAITNQKSYRMNLRLLGKFLFLLLLIIVAFSIGFHVLMLLEGRDYSWFTGVYWALTVMSTLGFGDIVFSTDAGRAFSVLVLLTGMIFLLVLLPFTFIQFFYAPWMEAQQEARAPGKVPASLRNHVVLTNQDPVSSALIERLKQYGAPYVLVQPDTIRALECRDAGVEVVRADLNDPASFERLGLDRAAMLVTTASDVVNTSIAFTARNLAPKLTIVSTASARDSVDVLQLAGCDQVIRLGKMLGGSLARRTIGGDAQAHIIGQIDKIRIAEATTAGTPLLGKSLRQSRLRETTGLTVIGMWERGSFRVPGPDDVMESSTVLVLAGTEEQIANYNQLLCIYHQTRAPVIIVGAGRVGRATGAALAEMDIDHIIVDNDPSRTLPEKFLLGSAADLETLQKAGIQEAPAVIITTREDDLNIFLTIYCRKLRPDIQIIVRTTLDSNSARMHRAGADFVMSYASMGANILFNLLRKEDILLVAEGLNVFRLPVPQRLVGRSLLDSEVRESTGCSIIAIQQAGETIITPDPSFILREGDGLVLIGTVDAEEKFLDTYLR